MNYYKPTHKDKIKERQDLENRSRSLHKEDISTKGFIRGSESNYPIEFFGSDHVAYYSKSIKNVTVIAGSGVRTIIRDAPRLESLYRVPMNRWQKVSGVTSILFKGKPLKAEIHWYEANGQVKEVKVKRVFKDES